MLQKVGRYYTPGGLHASVEGGNVGGGGGGRGISNSEQSPRRFRVFTIKAGVFIPSRGNRTLSCTHRKALIVTPTLTHFAYYKPP